MTSTSTSASSRTRSRTGTPHSRSRCSPQPSRSTTRSTSSSPTSARRWSAHFPEFEKSGRSIPALVTSDGNVLACFQQEKAATNPDFSLFTVATGNDNVRLAVQHAVARATGGVIPSSDVFEAPVFENSITDDPNPVTCRDDLPGDIYLSAQMSAEDQAALLK